MAKSSDYQQWRIPAGWETTVRFFNHSELNYINNLARKCGVAENTLPFEWVEKLVDDTGERFFSEYSAWLMATKHGVDDCDLCLCQSCSGKTTRAICVPAPAPVETADPSSTTLLV